MDYSTETLLELLYGELRSIARKKMRNERSDHTLQATALVGEVFVKLSNRPKSEGWASKSHFLRTATEAMRRILVDQARARLSRKRGGDRYKESFADIPVVMPLPSEEIIAIHDCLDAFAVEDPIKAQLVKLRVFAGLTQKEAAAELGIPRRTADRYWEYARLRLRSMIE